MVRRKATRGARASRGASRSAEADCAVTASLFPEAATPEPETSGAEPTAVKSQPATSSAAGDRNKSGVVITTLATFPDRAVVDESALAQALGVSKRTLRRMVARFELPPPVPFAGRSTWIVGRVLAWFDARAERASREAERMARRMDGLK